MSMELPVELTDIQAAAKRIAPYVRRTPIMNAASLDELAGGELLFKCENLQRAGSFKARGATNAVFALSNAEARKGVATHSSGNHGAALARAATLRGIPCHVVVPEGANPVKRAAIARYGARIHDCPATMAGREAALERLVRERGAHVVHPYADTDVIAGQGTVALELFEDAATFDVLVVPLGGGGLLSGCATVAKALHPKISVIGVEPSGAPRTDVRVAGLFEPAAGEDQSIGIRPAGPGTRPRLRRTDRCGGTRRVETLASPLGDDLQFRASCAEFGLGSDDR
ncbi:MAG: pyridoxal-phosphate dependent enzyme, partial [Proteobacteria bacterium]|nr:pyridoxal-phosphate dependent enzyme [Pseudomonadota bacterium]